MNLPNKLTVLRVIMIPFFLVFFFLRITQYHMFIALAIFAVASLTDMLDGQIARKHNLVTSFGKLMDPLADKLLVTSAMICILGFTYQLDHPNIFAIVALIIIISRDLVVNSIRLVAASDGIVIAADGFGKIKTALQMVWTCVALLKLAIMQTDVGSTMIRVSMDSPNPPLTNALYVISIISSILFYAMLIMTVVSGINYVVKNKAVFADA